MAIYGIHAIKLVDVNLTQVTDVRVNAGLAQLAVIAGGQIDPTFIATSKSAPAITFQTTELKRVLDKLATPWSGLKVTASGAPVIIYFQKHTPYGTRSVAADFMSITITDCIVVPRTLAASDGQPASITLEIVPALQAGTNVVTVATAVANPTISMTVDELWTTGPIKINTAALDVAKFINVQQSNVDFGIELSLVQGDGTVYAQFVSIGTRQPRMTAQLTDETPLTELSTAGEMTGVAQGANKSTLFLRKMSANGSRVALATAEHIKFDMTGGPILPDTFGAAGSTPAQTGIILMPAYDLTNPLIGVSTATAIS